MSHRSFLCVMCKPSGLENTPETCQQAMAALLAKAHSDFSAVNLDEIVIFLQTPEERIGNVQQIMTVLYDTGETLNLESE